MCKRVVALWPGLILRCLVLLPHANWAVSSHKPHAFTEFSARGFGRALAQCLSSAQKLRCVEEGIVRVLDEAILDNSTWCYSDFLLIEKTVGPNARNGTSYLQLLRAAAARERLARERSFGDTVGEKLLQLAETRSVRMQLPQVQLLGDVAADAWGAGGVSDALDGISNAVTIDVASVEEGRKKKDKDKNMATLGGMAMMAMVAQMFFGKVLIIAGSAFVMAKIALIVSMMGSLKKGSGGSSGSPEHVIVTSGVGGHGYESGWHRSMPPEEYSQPPTLHSDEHFDPHPSLVHRRGGFSPTHGHSGVALDPNYYNYETTHVDAAKPDLKKTRTSGFL